MYLLWTDGRGRCEGDGPDDVTVSILQHQHQTGDAEAYLQEKLLNVFKHVNEPAWGLAAALSTTDSQASTTVADWNVHVRTKKQARTRATVSM